MDDLETFLNGPEPVEADTPATETPEAPAVETPPQPRDDSGRFAPKGVGPEAPAVSASPAPKEDPPLEHPALLGERRRRQEAEARAEALERQLQSRPAAAPTEKPLIPHPLDDAEGYMQGVIEAARAEAQAEARRLAMEASGATRTDVMREIARSRYADFEQIEASYFDLARANPAVREFVAGQPNPVQAAYEYTKKHLEVQQLGSLDLEAIKAAAVQEYLARTPAPAAPAAPLIPTSLADAQSSRGAVTGAPPSLDDILGRR